MSIYDKAGTPLSSCYSANGAALTKAYDKDGTQVWQSEPTTLKVCTYNVGDWGWGAGLPSADRKAEYLALQNAIFSNISADICGMQEWDTRFCSDGTLSSVVTDEYFDYLQGSGYWAIGSNIPFIGFTAYGYTTVSAGGDYAKYDKAYFTIGGKNVCVINCHFDTAQSTQEAQAAEILSVAQGETYCIVMGDWNTVIHSLTDTDYINMVKPYIDAGFTDANCGEFGIIPTYFRTNSTEPSDGYTPATDHILVTPNITITNAYTEQTKVTDSLTDKIDHLPLVAELVIN